MIPCVLRVARLEVCMQHLSMLVMGNDRVSHYESLSLLIGA